MLPELSSKVGENGFHGIATGCVEEDERKFVLVHGWESQDAFRAYYASLDEAKIEALRKPLKADLESLEQVFVDLKSGGDYTVQA